MAILVTRSIVTPIMARQKGRQPRMKRNVWGLDDKDKEVRVDPEAKSVLSLAQVASFNFKGMGAKARRDAVERAGTCRLEDGAYSVSCQGEEGAPALVLDDEE